MDRARLDDLSSRLGEPVPAVRKHTAHALFGGLVEQLKHGSSARPLWDSAVRQAMSSQHADVVEVACTASVSAAASDFVDPRACASPMLDALGSCSLPCAAPLCAALGRLTLVIASRAAQPEVQAPPAALSGADLELQAMLTSDARPPATFAQAAAAPKPAKSARDDRNDPAASLGWGSHPLLSAMRVRLEALPSLVAAFDETLQGVCQASDAVADRLWSLGIEPVLQQVYLAPLASAHNPAPDALRRAVHASLIRHACVDPAATEPALRFLTRFLSHALRGVPPASPSAPAEAAFCASVATDALDVVDCLSDDWEGPGGSGEAESRVSPWARELASACVSAAAQSVAIGTGLSSWPIVLARLRAVDASCTRPHAPTLALMALAASDADAAVLHAIVARDLSPESERSNGDEARTPATSTLARSGDKTAIALDGPNVFSLVSPVVQSASLLPPGDAKVAAIAALRSLCEALKAGSIAQGGAGAEHAAGGGASREVARAVVWCVLSAGQGARQPLGTWGGDGGAWGDKASRDECVSLLQSLENCLTGDGLACPEGAKGASHAARTALDMEVPSDAPNRVLAKLHEAQSVLGIFLCHACPDVVEAACRCAGALVRQGRQRGTRAAPFAGTFRGVALALLPVALWRVRAVAESARDIRDDSRKAQDAALCAVSLLHLVPSLCVHPSATDLAIQALVPLTMGAGLDEKVAAVVRPCALRVLAAMWNVGKASWRSVFPILLGDRAPMELHSDPLSLRLTRALCVRDICAEDGGRGLDLLPALQSALHDPHPYVAALALETVATLCDQDCLDFFKSVRAVLDVFPDLPSHPRLAAAWVSLLRCGSYDAHLHPDQAGLVLRLLWRATAHTDAAVRAAAAACLAQYDPALMEQQCCMRPGSEIFHLLASEEDPRVRKALEPLIVTVLRFEGRTRGPGAGKGGRLAGALRLAEDNPTVAFLTGGLPRALAGRGGGGAASVATHAVGLEGRGCLRVGPREARDALDAVAPGNWPREDSDARATGAFLAYVGALVEAVSLDSALLHFSSPPEAVQQCLVCLRPILERLVSAMAAHVRHSMAEQAGPPGAQLSGVAGRPRALWPRALAVTVRAEGGAGAEGRAAPTRVLLHVPNAGAGADGGDLAGVEADCCRSLARFLRDLAKAAMGAEGGDAGVAQPGPSAAVWECRVEARAGARMACNSLGLLGSFGAVAGKFDVAVGQETVEGLLESSRLCAASALPTATGPALAAAAFALSHMPAPDLPVLESAVRAYAAALRSPDQALSVRGVAAVALGQVCGAARGTQRVAGARLAAKYASLAAECWAALLDAAAAALGPSGQALWKECLAPVATALPREWGVCVEWGNGAGSGSDALPLAPDDRAALLGAVMTGVATCAAAADVEVARPGGGGAVEATAAEPSLLRVMRASRGAVERRLGEWATVGGASSVPRLSGPIEQALVGGMVELEAACWLTLAQRAGLAEASGGDLLGQLCAVLARGSLQGPGLPERVLSRVLLAASAVAAAALSTGAPLSTDKVSLIVSLSASMLNRSQWVGSGDLAPSAVAAYRKTIAAQSRQAADEDLGDSPHSASTSSDLWRLLMGQSNAGSPTACLVPDSGAPLPRVCGPLDRSAAAAGISLLLTGTHRLGVVPWARVGGGGSTVGVGGVGAEAGADETRGALLARPLLLCADAGVGPALCRAALLALVRTAGLEAATPTNVLPPTAGRAAAGAAGDVHCDAADAAMAARSLACVCAGLRAAVALIAGPDSDNDGGSGDSTAISAAAQEGAGAGFPPPAPLRGLKESSFLHATLSHVLAIASAPDLRLAAAAGGAHSGPLLCACLGAAAAAGKLPALSLGPAVLRLAQCTAASETLQEACIGVLVPHSKDLRLGCLAAVQEILASDPYKSGLSRRAVSALIRAVPAIAATQASSTAGDLYTAALHLALAPAPPTDPGTGTEALVALLQGMAAVTHPSTSPAVDAFIKALSSPALLALPPADPGVWIAAATAARGAAQPGPGGLCRTPPDTLASLLDPDGSQDTSSAPRPASAPHRELWGAVAQATLRLPAPALAPLLAACVRGSAGAPGAGAAAFCSAVLVWAGALGPDVLSATTRAVVRGGAGAEVLSWLGLAVSGLPLASQQQTVVDLAALLRAKDASERRGGMIAVAMFACAALGALTLAPLEAHAACRASVGVAGEPLLAGALVQLLRTSEWQGAGAALCTKLADTLQDWASAAGSSGAEEVTALAKVVLAVRGWVPVGCLETAFPVAA